MNLCVFNNSLCVHEFIERKKNDLTEFDHKRRTSCDNKLKVKIVNAEILNLRKFLIINGPSKWIKIYPKWCVQLNGFFLTAIAIQKKINEKNCILFEVFILEIFGANRLFSYIFIVLFGLPQNVTIYVLRERFMRLHCSYFFHGLLLPIFVFMSNKNVLPLASLVIVSWVDAVLSHTYSGEKKKR